MQAAHTPVTQAAQTAATQAAQSAGTQSAQTPLRHDLYVHAIESAVAIVVAYLLWRLACAAIDRFFARRFLSRHPRASTYVVPVKTLTGFIILASLALVLLNIWSVNISPALWSAGVVTAALAFGAQWVVRDLLAGFSIFAEGQFDVGDKVQITTGVNSVISGTIEAIGWRTTRLIDLQGRTVFIPNGNIYTSTNLSKGQERTDVTLVLPLKAGVAVMRSDIEKTARTIVNEAKINAADVRVTLDSVSGDAATFTISVRAPQIRTALSEAELRERIVGALQADGSLPGGATPSNEAVKTGVS